MRVRKLALSVACVAALGTHVKAADTKTISLVGMDGTRIEVATLDVASDGAFSVTWDDTKFDDFFLSMRPFKCLEGPEKLWCRVGYPYENKRSLAGGDPTDLEYDLLWVWKNAADYGINMWNGVYYRLTPEGDGWIGALHEMDMDVIAAPPEDGDLRPITEDNLDEGDPDSHWLPTLVVE